MSPLEEASSNGDKILSENYLQHADHFTRILNEQENYKKIKYADNQSSENNPEIEELSNKSEEVKNEDNKKVVGEIKPLSQKATDEKLVWPNNFFWFQNI